MKTDFTEIAKYTLPSIVIIIGWLVGNYFTKKRDRVVKRRDISLEHLIKAYGILTHEISHREESEDKNDKLEQMITEIQLFGSEGQIVMAKQLAIEVSNGGEFQLDPLINSLRNDLRKQLGLTEVDSNVTWLRMISKK